MGKNKPANKIVNFNRNNLKPPGNKMVPGAKNLEGRAKDLDRKIENTQKKIDNIQKKIIQNEVKEADIIDRARDTTDQWRQDRKGDRHQLKKGLHKNRLQLSSKFKRSRPTIRFEQAPLGSFDRRTGVGKQIFGTGFKGATEYETLEMWRSIDRINKHEQKLAKQLHKKNLYLAKSANKLRILNRSRYLMDTLAAGANEFPGQTLAKGGDSFKRLITTDNAVKFTRLGIGALKTAKNLAAGYVLNAASEKYLAPYARKAGHKLGISLRPLARAWDDVLPGINSEDERRRKAKQLLIRKQKDGE
jgi:hypothetical protein